MIISASKAKTSYTINQINWGVVAGNLPISANIDLPDTLILMSDSDFEPDEFWDAFSDMDDEEEEEFWDSYEASKEARDAIDSEWISEIMRQLEALFGVKPVSFGGYQRSEPF